MKILYLSFATLLVLAVLITGCTTQPAQLPATPAPTSALQTPLLTPAPVPPGLTNTEWNLAWFDDTRGVWTKVTDGSNVTATFFAEGKVTGSGGCNGYTTDFQIGEPDRIWFRRPTVPEHLCQTPVGVMSQESAFFTDLGWAETYSITGGQLVILDKTGKRILQFETL